MLHVRALRLQRAPLLALAAFAVLAAGCGSDSGDGKLLSQRQASELRGTLTQVEQDVDAKNCTGAEQQVAGLRDQIDSIRQLDPDLRRALRASTRRLETLVSQDCQTTPAPEVETPAPTPDEGTTGTTGPAEKQKKPKKEKKDESTPPGKDEQIPPGESGQGGGAGVPGESNPNGGGG
jgi:hypothetical protein